MEGSPRDSPGVQRPDQAGRGRGAENPAQIPKPGWRDIFLRTKEEVREGNVSLLADGTAFFFLLGLVPGLAALISIYGLIGNPAEIQTQFEALARVMPSETRTLLEQQMTSIVSRPKTAGFATALAIILALWGASTAMKTLMNALNVAYDEAGARRAGEGTWSFVLFPGTA